MPQACQNQRIHKCVCVMIVCDCVGLGRLMTALVFWIVHHNCGIRMIIEEWRLSLLLDHTATLCCNTVKGQKFSVKSIEVVFSYITGVLSGRKLQGWGRSRASCGRFSKLHAPVPFITLIHGICIRFKKLKCNEMSAKVQVNPFSWGETELRGALNWRIW